MNGESAVNVQVAVKPVFVQLLHSNAYEGPCRVGNPEDLDPKKEKARGEKQFTQWTKQVENELSDEAHMLDPVKIEWTDDWHLSEEQIGKLDQDISEVDFFLIQGGLSQYPAISIGRRYKKPIVMVGTVVPTDVSANLRARGLEGFAPLDYEELNDLISLLRIRKSFQNTKILHAVESEVVPVGVVSTIYDMEDLHNRFGVQHHGMPADHLINQMKNLSDDSKKQAEQLTDKLIENAEECHMEREDLLPSVEFYVAVKEEMKKRECNAFAIPCFELCARQVPAETRVTFCLAHTLLKDEGYPSACEDDMNVLMSMAALMYTSRKSSYMGNSSLVSKEENIIRVGHDVPGLKMNGFDSEDLPYTITPFTQGGWGGTIRYDFTRDVGQPVTLARFNPNATRLLVATGEVSGGGGVDTVGCSLSANFKVNDAVELFHAEQDFGHHLAMVYGDYSEQLHELEQLMDIEIIEV